MAAQVGSAAGILEVDKAAWFTIGTARQKILKGQAGFLDQLLKKIPGLS